MIRHVVLFTLREGVSAATPRVRRVAAAEEALPARIPADRSWRFGADLTGRAVSASLAEVGDFTSTVADIELWVVRSVA